MTAHKETPRSSLEIALDYHLAGLSVLPIRPDGSKAPALRAGHPFLHTRPSRTDLQVWFTSGRNGIAIGCGPISGNLETLDFETVEICQAWKALVEQRQPGLVERLCWVRTPGHLGQPGLHARYRCPGAVIPGSTALAREHPPGGRLRVLIETRGTGGYAIAPGSPASCHPTGGTWRHVAGPDLCHLPELSVPEREVLIQCARELDRWQRRQEHNGETLFHHPAGNALPEAEEYNRNGPDWSEILTPHGWRLVRSAGGVRYWKRPGKELSGWSATTGHCLGDDGTDLLHVFTSNGQPFEQGRCYSKFSAFVLLEHQGDYQAAIQHLRQNAGKPPDQAAGKANGRGDLVSDLFEVFTVLRGACVRAACLTDEEDGRLRSLLQSMQEKLTEENKLLAESVQPDLVVSRAAPETNQEKRRS
jgi:putative DNA primase/helicase